jgi:hypothetical protein
MSDDFQLVNTGKIFLKQGGTTLKQADMTIDKPSKSGSCTLSDITVGNYNILLELYDNDTVPRIIYNASDTVSIVAGDNGTKQMTLQRYVGTVSISGSWTEDIPVVSATAELKKSGATVYGTSLGISGKTVSGGIQNVYPDTYDLYVAVKNGGGVVKFDGTKSVTVAKGPNSTVISLVVKTGSIQIQVNGDATAPNITSGPSYTVSGTDVTVTWTTDEQATSAVCYSQTQGFDYQSSLSWAPLGGDLTADHTSHSVTISGLTDGATYYYVVVSADASGNLKVSDEKSLASSGFPIAGLLAYYDFDQTYGNSLPDKTANGRHGTLFNMEDNDWVTGKLGNALQLDGIDEWVDLQYDLGALAPSGTLSFWVMPAGTGTATWGNSIMGMERMGANSGDWEVYSMRLDGSYEIIWSLEDASTSAILISDTTFPIGTWAHVVLLWGTDGMGFYVNGQFQLQIDALPDALRGPWCIGRILQFASTYSFYDGLVDEVALWNRRLGATEIAELYNGGNGTFFRQ